MDRVVIVHQVTGNHGRGAVGIYHQLFQAAFPETKLTFLDIKVEWNTLNLDTRLDSLARQIRQVGPESILVFLGASWHSRVIHKNPTLRSITLDSAALKIGIFQESYLAKKGSTSLIKEMKGSYINACDLFDIKIFNHYRDYLAAQAISKERRINDKLLYLPFLNPVKEVSSCNLKHSSERKNRILFVGDCPSYPGNPYIARHLLLERASRNESFDWIRPNKISDQHVPHEDYINRLRSYNFALIPPSIDTSLTVRQIEACAAGAIPLTPSPVYDLERLIFKDGHNCFYYNPLDDIDELFAKILSLSSSRVEEVRSNALATAHHHTPAEVAPRLRQFVLDDLLLSPAFRELTSVDPLTQAPSQVRAGWKVGIDLVFFQYADTGIAKVWESLLNFLAEDPIRDSIVLFIRKDSPFVPGVARSFHSVELPSYDADNKEQDAHLVDWACDQEDVAVFVSTYMTYSHCKHNVVMIHDCIPERVAKRVLYEPIWDAKRAAISNADSILTISRYSSDEILAFYPEARNKNLFVTPNAIRQSFLNAHSIAINSDSTEDEDSQTSSYCLLVGERNGYLGYKNGSLALQALDAYNEEHAYTLDLKVVGGWRSDSHPLSKFDLEPELLCDANKLRVTRSVVSDADLIGLYRSAVCLLYLSEDEGYGLPIYECLASGGRVIVLDRPFNQGITHPNLIKVQDSSASQVSQAISRACSQKQSGASLGTNPVSLIPAFSPSQSQGQQISEILQLIQLAETADPSKTLLHNNILTNKFQNLSEACHYILSRHPANVRTLDNGNTDQYKFGYITSTYKSSQFFGQLIEDILGSNHVPGSAEGRMAIEHIVIDSNSPEDEISIYRNSECGDFCSYLYYRTPYRETLYSAWNRGIRLSEATYISNANTDDRHSPFFAYVSSLYLDSRPDVMLAYPDQIISEVPNTRYMDEISRRRWAWPQYAYAQILTGNHVGSTPVWRRSLHSNIRYFNQDYRCAGDWDFWLRIATRAGALGLINLPLSSYLFNASGIEHGDPRQSLRECQQIQNHYATFGEYTISDQDHETAELAGNRTIDDMQYSGFIGSRLTLIIVDAWTPTTIGDILSLGQFDARADISICLVSDQSLTVLPQRSYFGSVEDIFAISQSYDAIDVYLHKNAFSCIASPVMPQARIAAAFSHSLRLAEDQPQELPNFLFYSDFHLLLPNT